MNPPATITLDDFARLMLAGNRRGAYARGAALVAIKTGRDTRNVARQFSLPLSTVYRAITDVESLFVEKLETKNKLEIKNTLSTLPIKGETQNDLRQSGIDATTFTPSSKMFLE